MSGFGAGSQEKAPSPSRLRQLQLDVSHITILEGMSMQGMISHIPDQAGYSLSTNASEKIWQDSMYNFMVYTKGPQCMA